MPELYVTPIYGALVALLIAVLSSHVGLLRGKFLVPLGDGGVPELALTIRRFGNLSEYAAAALMMLLLMELKGIDGFWLHLYGAALITLRVLHPLALYANTDAPLWRKAGRFVSAAGTAALFAAAGVALLIT